MRKTISSGSRLEPLIGCSGAIRLGRFLSVSGTAPIAPDWSVAAPGDVYERTKRCLEVIAKAVADAGDTADSVVRTHVMLTDISRREEAARARGDVFGDVRPACTFVEVSRFIDPGWSVEIGADCVSDENA